jgi:hypothetical protein
MKRMLIWTGKGLCIMVVVCLPMFIVVPCWIYYIEWMDQFPDAWWEAPVALLTLLVPWGIWWMFITGCLGSTWKAIWNA